MSTSGEAGVAVAAFCSQHGRQGGLREGVRDWAQYAATWGFCLQSLESDIHGSRECRFPELLTSAALLRVACREQSVEKLDAVLMSISNGR